MQSDSPVEKSTSSLSKQRNRLKACLLWSFLFLFTGFNFIKIFSLKLPIEFYRAVNAPSTLGNISYTPSTLEKYIIDNSVKLGYAEAESPGCPIWKDPNVAPEIHKSLSTYSKELDNYLNVKEKFQPIPDLLKSIQETGSHDVCSTARPHPDGIQALFPSNPLSHTKSGFIEPITPPMRDHRICHDGQLGKYLVSLEYLVHDFESMCRRLKPWSRRVLIDMGASLEFHGTDQPIVNLIREYQKFGFVFDHVYGFEITAIPPQTVFQHLPEELMPSYHWINVGVSKEEGDKLNPLHSILKHFDEEDFIVVKLDIDSPHIEYSLANQLLEDKDGVYHKLVDQFYFEHHVHLSELKKIWGRFMTGTVKDSLDLFYSLREKGIPAHFWP